MDRMIFIEKFKDVLQRDENLSFKNNLNDIEEWDSLSKIATISFIDKEFGKKILLSELDAIETVEDIAKLAGV